MQENERPNPLRPEYVFEVSWEVANKVGGIHTVLSSKSKTMRKLWGDNYIAIGPDMWKSSGEKPEFIEDEDLFLSWKEQAQKENLKIRTGRWKYGNNCYTILVDFRPFYAQKDSIFTDLWTKYHLDSLSADWDYIEPAIFGYAAGKVIESFCQFHLEYHERVLAHFHEWMTGTGVLYLKEKAPQIGTAFTTHATVLGRSAAGNGLPLYKGLSGFSADQLAREFNVVAKQSLERKSAENADAFTTVSEITARECAQFLNKQPDIITPNGMDNSMIPEPITFAKKRDAARRALLKVATALTGEEFPENSLLVAQSGRYEYRNKGIDVFLDALGELNRDENQSRPVLAFIMVPGHQTGPREELVKRLQGMNGHPFEPEWLTHGLHNQEEDPVWKAIHRNRLLNSKDDTVKVFFVPTYLNGTDGIFNLHYYDLLIGFDLSVFPSYYEPWGYTPMESLAFHIPTITTNVAGFGAWMNAHTSGNNPAIYVLERVDHRDEVVADEITGILRSFRGMGPEEMEGIRQTAVELAGTVDWTSLIDFYLEAYSLSVRKIKSREHLFKDKSIKRPEIKAALQSRTFSPRWRKILVESEIPETLGMLIKLAKNLYWAWNDEVEELFESIDPEIWYNYKKNPVALLDVLPYAKLKRLEKNATFLDRLHRTYSRFEAYMQEPHRAEQPSIAYFCMEYGLHPVIRLYSGGLGILAGDYLKEASDSNLEMVGVGLLYRHGYFKQSLSLHGEQLVEYRPHKFTYLPVVPVRDEEDNWLMVSVAFPGRQVIAKIWKIDVGRIPLYLLDADIEENSPEDRKITYQLYGGDDQHRLKQEILLGIGGIRMLKKLNINADIYHCNEGHAAFMGLERIRNLMEADDLSFYEARDIVRSSTLFTTHTPVPAGHDAFHENLIRTYLSEMAQGLKLDWSTFLGLGRHSDSSTHEKFSMSYLAARLSQEINGVSRIHGDVSRQIFNELWPGFTPDELHIGYVTNGVHFDTWTAPEWKSLYRHRFGEGFLDDPESWKKILEVEDEEVWNIRKKLKARMIEALKTKIRKDLTNRHENPRKVLKIVNALHENALIFGFARRFATYKRAHLLFRNPDKLEEIISQPGRPVIFLFAGKAHPNDKAGQELIRFISELSEQPQFSGKIIFLENYEMNVAKLLVSGVDVWLNNPERPMEASGTSGMKAALNGVLNLSVQDGWWAEGYVPGGGWALPKERTYENREFQDELDAETMYRTIEHDVISTYFERNAEDLPLEWISMIKTNIASIAPHFTTRRMIRDYERKFYRPLYEKVKLLRSDNYQALLELSRWKEKVLANWPKVIVIDMNLHDSAHRSLPLGENFFAEIVLSLGELSAEDVGVEVIFSKRTKPDGPREIVFKKELALESEHPHRTVYKCNFPVTQSGVYEYGFRIFPKHKLLTNRMDFNLMKWI